MVASFGPTERSTSLRPWLCDSPSGGRLARLALQYDYLRKKNLTPCLARKVQGWMGRAIEVSLSLFVSRSRISDGCSAVVVAAIGQWSISTRPRWLGWHCKAMRKRTLSALGGSQSEYNAWKLQAGALQNGLLWAQRGGAVSN